MRAFILFTIVSSMIFFDVSMRDKDKKIYNTSNDKLNLCKVDVCYDTIYMDRASSYYPSYDQCARRDSLGNIDSTSNIYRTADGSLINMDKLKNKEIRWCALPKSMLTEYGGFPFSHGDKVLVYCESKPMVNGYWEVHDVVSVCWGKTIDFLIHPSNNINPKLGLPNDLVLLTNPKPILQ